MTHWGIVYCNRRTHTHIDMQPPFSAFLLFFFYSIFPTSRNYLNLYPSAGLFVPPCFWTLNLISLSLSSLCRPEMACIIAACCFSPLSLALLPPYLVIFLSSQIPTSQLIFAVPSSFVLQTLPLYPYMRHCMLDIHTWSARNRHLTPSHIW